MTVIAPDRPSDPLSEYIERRDHYQSSIKVIERRRAWLGNFRFVLVVVSGILLVISSFERSLPGWFAAIPFGLFLVTSPWAHRLNMRRHQALLKIRFYQFGVDRMEDNWMGKGTPGNEYFDEDHLYTQDLDIFGRGSLFERLCIAQTEVGRRALANWLSEPATTDEILARHEAIRELCEGLHWREHLEFTHASAKAIHTDALIRWNKHGSASVSPLGRILAPLLLLFTALMVAGWIGRFFDVGPVVLALVLQAGFAFLISRRVAGALGGVEKRSEDVYQLAAMLFALESKSFQSQKLEQLRAKLGADGLLPSRQLASLMRYLGYLELTHNPILGLALMFLLWRTQIGLAVESWRARTGPAMIRWLEVLGEIEALHSLAAYRHENPNDPFANITSDDTRIDAKALSHPLLPRAKSIANDCSLNAQEPLVIVSGSNMSGKSTYLRTIGVNIVLALAGAPVRAVSMSLSRVSIGTSLRTHDSLQAGTSRFYAEITRLRRIVDRTRDVLPVLFLLDEILNGTNSHDRRIGAEAIVRLLLSKKALGLITTHDLALTALPEHLGPGARNVHFQDELNNGELYFDYRLRPGVVQHSNALALMRAVGLIVDQSAPPPPPQPPAVLQPPAVQGG